jgi:hypothetical protein
LELLSRADGDLRKTSGKSRIFMNNCVTMRDRSSRFKFSTIKGKGKNGKFVEDRKPEELGNWEVGGR